MPEQPSSTEGMWVRLLSGVIIALIVAALLYAGVIGLLNLQRIGV